MNERERLANFYAGLSDEELINIGSQFKSLTDEAQALLREELSEDRSMHQSLKNRLIRSSF